MLLYLDFILSSLLSACFQVARQVSRKFRSIPSYFAFSLATVLLSPSIVTAVDPHITRHPSTAASPAPADPVSALARVSASVRAAAVSASVLVWPSANASLATRWRVCCLVSRDGFEPSPHCVSAGFVALLCPVHAFGGPERHGLNQAEPVPLVAIELAGDAGPGEPALHRSVAGLQELIAEEGALVDLAGH